VIADHFDAPLKPETIQIHNFCLHVLNILLRTRPSVNCHPVCVNDIRCTIHAQRFSTQCRGLRDARDGQKNSRKNAGPMRRP